MMPSIYSMFEGFGEPVMGSAAALSANPSSYLDNPLVSGKDCIQLHFGSLLFHEQHLVGSGGHGVAAGAAGQWLGQAGYWHYFTGMNQPPQQRMGKEINFSWEINYAKDVSCKSDTGRGQVFCWKEIRRKLCSSAANKNLD